MEIVTDLDGCTPPAGGSAVTIGAYDGLHLGHRALLAELRRRAAADGLVTTVVTFDRHPATVVRPASAPLLLCDPEQKLELLAEAGVDRTIVLTFDDTRADETAEEFVSEVLVRALATRVVVVGENFHFGHGRKGDVALLADLGASSGFTVDGVRLASADGSAGAGPISSTRIRALVAAGDVAAAARLLGRPHQVRGPVVHGDARGGSELGYPTANIAVPEGIALPAPGIYAGVYQRPDGSQWPSAVSVGLRPMFYEEGPLLVEAHLLDFAGDLYGEPARLSFVERLRDEQTFPSVDGLVAQMAADVAEARRILDPGA
jgi:riboflavin kinase/FMN adenylyltransferase